MIMRKNDNLSSNSKMVRLTKDLISIIFLSLVSLLALTFCIGLLLTNASLQRQADASRSELEAIESEGYYTTAKAEQLIEKAEANGRLQAEDELRDLFKDVLQNKGSLTAIRDLFPEDIIVVSKGEYHFYPIDDSIEQNAIKNLEFSKDDNGILHYYGGGEEPPMKLGVQVSRYQGEIDFDKVKESGVSFVMIRAGLRGNAEGTLLEDDYFRQNIKNAQAAGLDIGVYFESTAIDEAEAKEEAEFVLDLIQNADVTYPVAILIEEAQSIEERTSELDAHDYTQIAKAFCNRIEEDGYTSMIYGDVQALTELVNRRTLDTYDVWVNYIGEKIYYPYQAAFWEYTRTGRIDGISGGASLLMDFSGEFDEQ